MIAGYVKHGYGKEDFKLFLYKYQVVMRPYYIPFVSVVSACASYAPLE